MSHSPLAIANYFIQQSNNGVQHLKLQKLVYCAHGWWLQAHDESIAPIVSENPQAWQYGPVFPTLYYTLKPRGRTDIQEPQKALPGEKPPMAEGDEVIELLDFVWKRYRHLSGWALAEMTHKKGSPWYEISKKYGGPRKIQDGVEIPVEKVRAEFQAVAQAMTNGR